MKYSGMAGVVEDSIEISPGIWKPAGVREIKATGDFVSSRKEFSVRSDSTNDDVTMSNTISIVMSKDLFNNLSNLRYLTVNGARYKVTSFEINRPRIVITLGGLWNGDVPGEETKSTQ